MAPCWYSSSSHTLQSWKKCSHYYTSVHTHTHMHPETEHNLCSSLWFHFPSRHGSKVIGTVCNHIIPVCHTHTQTHTETHTHTLMLYSAGSNVTHYLCLHPIPPTSEGWWEVKWLYLTVTALSFTRWNQKSYSATDKLQKQVHQWADDRKSSCFFMFAFTMWSTPSTTRNKSCIFTDLNSPIEALIGIH